MSKTGCLRDEQVERGRGRDGTLYLCQTVASEMFSKLSVESMNPDVGDFNRKTKRVTCRNRKSEP